MRTGAERRAMPALRNAVGPAAPHPATAAYHSAEGGRFPMFDPITQQVKSQYGAVAASGLSGDHAGVRAVAEAFGYAGEDLDAVPAEANMGLSCGNPTAFASLRPGEVVVDLGCGGGLDVFLAAERVGPAGKAIGIDMTPEMIDRATRNARNGPGGRPVANVEFHLATIDRLPLADGSADCVISNCVINLAPDKDAVFREIARVLRPGGRVAVSDIALKRPLPPDLAASVDAWCGCVAGAISVDAYTDGLRRAGFAAVQVVDSGADLNAYAQVEGQGGCCSPVPAASGSPRGLPITSAGCCTTDGATAGTVDADLHARLAELLKWYDINEY